MKELLILVQAHNEENQIRNCVNSLKRLEVPHNFVCKVCVVLDRCTDHTKQIITCLGVDILEKNFRGQYASTSAENVAFALEKIKFGDLILKCDADIQQIPKNALLQLLPHLAGNTKRVSAEVKTRSGKWWLDFLFWLGEINRKITPLGEEPRGAFCIFERKTVKDINGFNKLSRSWDTAFDLKVKQKGWVVEKVKNVTVTERRNFTIRRLIKRQINDGKVRRQLGLSFWRTLLHSIFRGRIFVLYGYIIH